MDREGVREREEAREMEGWGREKRMRKGEAEMTKHRDWKKVRKESKQEGREARWRGRRGRDE